jgi:hypothetical protein
VSFCPHCGKSVDVPRPKVPWWKYQPEGPTVGLGCGTLLLIGLVVAIFSRPGLNEFESRRLLAEHHRRRASDKAFCP